MKVFITKQIPLIATEILTSYGHQVTSATSPINKDELHQQAQSHDALITMLSDPIDATFLQNNSHLQVIANYAVGHNNIDLQAAQKAGIRVSNTPDVLTNATADLALALLMATSRLLIPAFQNVEQCEWKGWEPQGFLGVELKGKTLGILGAGRIGQAFAHKCYHALGMRIIYHCPTAKDEFEKKYNAHHVPFQQLLQQSDVLSLHAPLTKQTRKMMGKEQFSQMKSNAIFINTARGQMHDEKALLDSIENKKLFAAGLDVTTVEPLPDDSPLRHHPNILILPHIGSATVETREAMAKMCAENIQAVVENREMPSEVTVNT